MKNFKEHMKIYGFMIKSIWEYSKKNSIFNTISLTVISSTFTNKRILTKTCY